MEIDLARDLVRTALRLTGELQQLLPRLKENCTEDEYRNLARDIAQAIDRVGVGLIDNALRSHPALKAEIEDSIERTGSYR